MKLQYSIEINRPAADVFAYLADHERMPTWISTLEASTPSVAGPLSLGSKFSQEHVERGKRIRFAGEVSEYEDASKLTLLLCNDDASIALRFLLEEQTGRTRLEQITEVKLNNMMLRMMAGAFESTVRERMKSDFETLKAHLEG